jgi:hypothetical protein
MAPVFMFLVLCSTDDSTKIMKTGAICGTEYLKHENCCHPWNRVPKTCKLVSSVEQSTENTKTGAIGGAEQVFMISVLCSTDDTSFYVFGILLHRWHQFSCFWYSAPLMIPVFMFSVFCSTDDTSFLFFGILLR